MTYIDAFKSKYTHLYPALMVYLENYYFNRLHKWCMAYRNFPHANTDTNMFLESYHNRIKTFYCKRRKNKRVDELIQLLLQIEEDDYWRLKQERFFNPSGATLPAEERHQRGMKITNIDVEEEEIGWKVRSQSNKDTFYMVKRVANCCKEDHCFSRCLEVSCIGLCEHLYSCTCEDKHMMCKHIHKVHSLLTGRQLAQGKNLAGRTREPKFVTPQGATIDKLEEKKMKKKLNDIAFIQDQLDKLQKLAIDSSVQALMLPHLKSTLSQLVIKCEAVKSCVESCPAAMNVTDPVKPNQKFSFIKK